MSKFRMVTCGRVLAHIHNRLLKLLDSPPPYSLPFPFLTLYCFYQRALLDLYIILLWSVLRSNRSARMVLLWCCTARVSTIRQGGYYIVGYTHRKLAYQQTHLVYVCVYDLHSIPFHWINIETEL